MLKIRLSRAGARKYPFYRIVVAEASAPRDGKFIEKLGTYNPLLDHENDERLRLVEDRIHHWLSKGAKPTDRVARLLSTRDLVAKPAMPQQTKKHLPGEKARARAEAVEG